MRVLFWSSVFWPKIGDVESHAAKLLPALRTCGHEYLVITTRDEEHEAEFDYYQGIPVYRLPFWRQGSYNDIDQLIILRNGIIRLERDFSPHVVHINRIDHGMAFYHLTHSPGRAPRLVTLHGEWPPAYDAMVAKTFRVADWVTGCSHAILDKGKRLVPAISQHSSLIPNGIEAPEICPEPLSFEAPRLLSLGRLSPEKGFDVAITAFGRSHTTFPAPAC